ncbi:MAG: hypothetical protein EOO40_04885, partial [Deltaproteobacteria bacterium]
MPSATKKAVARPYARSDSEDDVSMRVIADHARATAFLVADGIQPSNEGRGYVMRRIMRRAIRHGRRLGLHELFFAQICGSVVRTMQDAYPELVTAAPLIDKVAQTEEEGFRRTLEAGLKIFAEEVQSPRVQTTRKLAGNTVFKLYDTYGFPKDLTDTLAQELGLSLDEAGFQAAMEAQKARSRGHEAGDAAVGEAYKKVLQEQGPSVFIGYVHEDEDMAARPGAWRSRQAGDTTFLEAQVKVVALLQDRARCDLVGAEHGEREVDVVLQPTPFYGESGGQVGDAGVLSGTDCLARVVDTQKPLPGLHVCRVTLLSGALRVGDMVWAGYDPHIRKRTRAHHSATHLLHGALRHVLGEHVKQAGSMVDAAHLRFDYTHFSSPSPEELRAVEQDANARIDVDAPIALEELSYDEARELGAIALFGEKYGDRVRVITMGKSVELCGGTHARRTGELGLLLIVSEGAVQSGVRRIEAQVGAAARKTVRDSLAGLQHVFALLTQGAAAPPPAGDAYPSDAATVFASLSRNLEQQAAHMAQLPDAMPPDDAAPPTPSQPAVPGEMGYPQALEVVDSWRGIVQTLAARSSEAEAVAA